MKRTQWIPVLAAVVLALIAGPAVGQEQGTPAEQAAPEEAAEMTVSWSGGNTPLEVTTEGLVFHDMEVQEVKLRGYQSKRYVLVIQTSNTGGEDVVAVVRATLQNRDGEALKVREEKRKLKASDQNKKIKIGFRAIPDRVAARIESCKLEFGVEKD